MPTAPDQRVITYLYKFEFKGLWYCFTTYNIPVVYDQQTYIPAAIVHGEIDAETKAVTVTTGITHSILRDFFISSQVARFSLAIYRVTEGLPTPTQTYKIFNGDLQTVSFTGNVASGVFVPRNLRSLEKSLPRCFVTGSCNWALFSAGCKIDANLYEAEYPVEAVDRYKRSIRITDYLLLAKPNFLDYGRIIYTNGDGGIETQTIITASADTVSTAILYLDNVPRDLIGGPGYTVRVLPGCDKTAFTCNANHGNLPNFGGFDMIPDYNPTIDGIRTV